jgi:hypothetical protein
MGYYIKWEYLYGVDPVPALAAPLLGIKYF